MAEGKDGKQYEGGGASSTKMTHTALSISAL